MNILEVIFTKFDNINVFSISHEQLVIDCGHLVEEAVALEVCDGHHNPDVEVVELNQIAQDICEELKFAIHLYPASVKVLWKIIAI